MVTDHARARRATGSSDRPSTLKLLWSLAEWIRDRGKFQAGVAREDPTRDEDPGDRHTCKSSCQHILHGSKVRCSGEHVINNADRPRLRACHTIIDPIDATEIIE
jgi:hypothetical protein